MTDLSKLKVFLHAPVPVHLGVWQMAAPFSESGHHFDKAFEPPPSRWVVTAVKGNKVIVQKGLALHYLIQASLTACGVEWPLQGVEKRMPAVPIELTLFLPDDQFQTFKMACMPQWGRQDIEAECRVEAARLMQRPLEDLILDFEVQAAPEGALMAHVMVCDNVLVEAATAMFEKLGFKLNNLTCHSDLQAYAQDWNVSPDALEAMVHESAAAC
jgi:hypothetical protein